MKKFEINIEKETVTTNGQTCNFYEAGLYEPGFGNTAVALSSPAEIKAALIEQYDGEEIDIVFIGSFDQLVEEAIDPNGDLEKSIRGLLMFARRNESEQGKQAFLEWLDDSTCLDAIRTHNTRPGDHFECAEGKTWEDMEEYYSENR